MKRALSAFFIALIFVTVSHAIQIGDLPAEVTSTKGEPVAVRTKPSGAQVWKMRDGTTVWLVRGVVSEVALPEEGSSIKRGGVAVPLLPAEEATAPTNLVTPEKTAVAKESVDFQPQISQLLLVVGLVVVVVTKFQFCQLVFKGRGCQLFGCLIPFVAFAFVFSHWRETKKLFAWQMFVALPLLVVGFHLFPASPVLERAGLGRAALTHSPAHPRAAAR
ncbi:MAG: hypothetical protein ABIO94_00790 [Opitutaceae bacterium]